MAFRVDYSPASAIASAAQSIGQGKRMAEYADAQRQSQERAMDRMFRASEAAQNRGFEMNRMAFQAGLENQRAQRDFNQQKEMFGLQGDRAKENMQFQADLSQQAAEAAAARNKDAAEWNAGLSEQTYKAKLTFEDQMEQQRIDRDRANVEKALAAGNIRPEDVPGFMDSINIRDRDLRARVQERLPNPPAVFPHLRPDQQPGQPAWKAYDKDGQEIMDPELGEPERYETKRDGTTVRSPEQLERKKALREQKQKEAEAEAKRQEAQAKSFDDFYDKNRFKYVTKNKTDSQGNVLYGKDGKPQTEEIEVERSDDELGDMWNKRNAARDRIFGKGKAQGVTGDPAAFDPRYGAMQPRPNGDPLPQIATAEEYNRLPPGAHYVSNGQVRVKGLRRQ